MPTTRAVVPKVRALYVWLRTPYFGLDDDDACSKTKNPMISRAIVLYGRVGTRSRAAALPLDAPADAALWQTCAETTRDLVLNAWQRNGNRVEIFIHSWNLELAQRMDEFWRPNLIASAHAAQNDSLRCPVKLKLCERSMWALLSMKRALALRSNWEAKTQPHAAVLVARHDVYWRTEMPPVRTDNGVRLWLPLDCHLSYCRNNDRTSCDLGNRITRNATVPPSDLVLLKHSQSVFFGTRCDGNVDELPPICSATVLIDWWFVASRSIADGFAATFDSFASYSQTIKDELKLAVSAPHQYWGLYFFRTLGLRARCEVGHVLMHALDFTLGRFLPPGVNARSTCRWSDEWWPHWHPPAGTAACASGIPGYHTSCPEPPPRPVLYECA